jgi:glutamate/aspartate transport system permease protein
MHYNWNWGILVTEPYSQWLATGVMWTIIISLSAWVIAMAVGSLMGISRTLPARLPRLLGAIYVEVFRNIPPLVQMFLWFYVVPDILPRSAGQWVKREMYYPEFTTAVICLGLYTASKVAEQVRAGIEGIPKDLVAAARATGLKPWQVYAHVQLPLAYRTIVPPLTSEFLGLFKNSSLALTIGMLELTAQSRRIESYTFQSFEAFTAATLLYLLVNGALLLAVRRFEPLTRVHGTMGQLTHSDS